jgi:ketosteroid isomerase-like protein
MALIDELQAMGDDYVSAYRTGDLAGCAAVFTMDAILYSAFAPPAVGHAAIAALHEIWTKGGEGKTLTVADAGGSGDIAWARADFAEGRETTEGHALWACVRVPGGPWRIRICSLTAA